MPAGPKHSPRLAPCPSDATGRLLGTIRPRSQSKRLHSHMLAFFRASPTPDLWAIVNFGGRDRTRTCTWLSPRCTSNAVPYQLGNSSILIWRRRRDSNPQPPCGSTCFRGKPTTSYHTSPFCFLVDGEGIEPPALCS